MGRSFIQISEILLKRVLQKTIWKNEKFMRNLFVKKYTRIKNNVVVKQGEKDSLLHQKLVSNSVCNIKLIGDSLTYGVGVWTYHKRGDSSLIIAVDNEEFRESPKSIHTWSNYFREYISENFSSVSFQNYGLPGKSGKWINLHRESLVNDSEDVVFIMVGTNDRWDCSSVSEFEKNLEELLIYVNSRCKLMYVFSPPPVANGEEHLNFGMREVNEVVKKVCEKHDYNFLSHYENMLQYSHNEGIPLFSLFEKNGSHPIDLGYIKMWEYVKVRLNLI